MCSTLIFLENSFFYYFWYLLRFDKSFLLPTYKYNSEIMSLYRPCLIFQHYHLISNLNRLNLIGYFDIIFKRQANLVLILALTICIINFHNRCIVYNNLSFAYLKKKLVNRTARHTNRILKFRHEKVL